MTKNQEIEYATLKRKMMHLNTFLCDMENFIGNSFFGVTIEKDIIKFHLDCLKNKMNVENEIMLSDIRNKGDVCDGE